MAKGEVKYRLTLDAKPLNDGLKQASTELSKFGGSFASQLGPAGSILSAMGPYGQVAAAGVGALATAGMAAGVAVAAAVNHLIDMADRLDELSSQTGMSAEELQQLGFAAKLSGSSLEEVASATNKMQKALIEGNTVFERLGLSAAKLKAESPDQAFRDVAEAIRQLPTAAQQSAAAMEAFGKAGAALLPTINAGLDEAAAKARELGIVLSGADVKAAADLKDQTDTLAMAWEGVINQFGAAVVSSGAMQPVIAELTKTLGELSQWTTDHRSDIAGFFTVMGEAASKALSLTKELLSVDIALLREMSSVFDDVAAVAMDLNNGLKLGTTAAGMEDAAARAGIDKARQAPFEGSSIKGGSAKVTGPAFRSQADVDKAAKAAKELEDAYAKAWESMAAKEKKAKEELDKYVEALGSKLGPTVEQIAEKFDEVQFALDVKGGLGALSDVELKNYQGELSKIIALEDQMTPAQWEAQAAAAQEAARRAKEEGDYIEVGNGLWMKHGVAAEEASQKAAAAATEEEAKLREVAAAQAEVLQKMQAFGQLLQGISDAFIQMGGSADSGFGRVLAGAAGAMPGVEAFQKARGMKPGFERNMAMGSAAGQVLGAASGALGGQKSAGGRALAGAAMGAQIGAIAGPWGMAAGAVVGAIVGIFHKPSWVKVGKDAGKILGFAVSDELAKAIDATKKKLGVSTEAATLLHLDEAMAESGKNAGQMSAEVFKLMAGVANGSIPAKEGVEQIDKAFGSVVESARKAGTVGDAMTVGMLKAAQASHQMTDGMKAFVSEQNQAMAGGAAKIGAGMAGMDLKNMGDFGKNAATFFASGFTQAIQEQGLMGALDSLGASAKAMFDQMVAAGDTAGAAMLEPFAALQSQIGENDQLKGMVTTLEGMGEVFKGAANQGLMDPAMQKAFGESMLQTRDALVAAGVDGKTAMQGILPELKAAVDASQQMGVPLDENTQKLKDQAEAMGYSFNPEPIIQLVDLMKTLVEGMGFALPASATKAAAAMDQAGQAAAGAAQAAAAAASTTATTTAAAAASSSAAWMESGQQTAAAVATSMETSATSLEAFNEINDLASQAAEGAWVSNFGELPIKLNQMVPDIEQGFTDFAAAADPGLISVRDKIQGILGGLGAIPDAAEKAGASMGGLDSGSGRGSGDSGDTSRGGRDGSGPGAMAVGGIVPHRRGGTIKRLAEAGVSEVVIPLPQFPKIVAAAMRAAGTGGPGGVISNVSFHGIRPDAGFIQALNYSLRYNRGGATTRVRRVGR